MATIGVISDVHGNLPALRTALDELNTAGIDSLVCCGDIIGILGWPEETANLIRDACDHVVLGNHDCRVHPDYVYAPSFPSARDEHAVVTGELSAETVEWLTSLPTRIETDEYIIAHSWPKQFRDTEASVTGFTTGDGGVTPRNATKAGRAANGKVVMLGHTHEAFSLRLDKFEGLSGTILNPGSIGVPWYEPAEYAIVDTETQEVDLRLVEYDTDSVKGRLDQFDDEYDLTTWTAERRNANL